jgi:hypothetical protein
LPGRGLEPVGGGTPSTRRPFVEQHRETGQIDIGMSIELRPLSLSQLERRRSANWLRVGGLCAKGEGTDHFHMSLVIFGDFPYPRDGPGQVLILAKIDRDVKLVAVGKTDHVHRIQRGGRGPQPLGDCAGPAGRRRGTINEVRGG